MISFLIRSATYQTSTYPIVLMRLDRSHVRSKPLKKNSKVYVAEIENVPFWLVVRHLISRPMNQSIILSIRFKGNMNPEETYESLEM
jgi:hypothetical protein